LVDFVGHFLFEIRLNLHCSLFRHYLKISSLHLYALAQLVSLIVHVDDDALEDRLLLRELRIDGFVQGYNCVLRLCYQFVKLFIFSGQ
jgi:hypothetical protein